MAKQPSRLQPLLPWSVAPPKAHTERTLAAALTARVGRGVEVALGRSRTLPVQLQRVGDAFRLRLHAFFCAVPDDVLDALSAWVANGRRSPAACARLDAWIDAETARLPARPKPDLPLRPRGNVHDLTRLARELCAGSWLLDLPALPRLTWGRMPATRRDRVYASLQLGLFVPETETVRINPVLDDLWVPAWFVRSVLFHELLHAAIPAHRDQQGRWIKHGRDFQRRERAFEDHRRAQVWLAANIRRLLVAARG